jgi:hypothetical protein
MCFSFAVVQFSQQQEFFRQTAEMNTREKEKVGSIYLALLFYLLLFFSFFFFFFFCCENKFLYCIVGPIVCVPLQLGHIDSSYGARTKKLELEIHSCRLSSLIA